MKEIRSAEICLLVVDIRGNGSAVRQQDSVILNIISSSYYLISLQYSFLSLIVRKSSKSKKPIT